MICYPCSKTLQERKFPNNLKIEPSFTDSNIGFCNWKKAIEKFHDHKKSRQHKVAVEVQLYVTKQGTISTQLDAAMLNSQEQWRSFLVGVITSLKFLGECALPVRGHDTDSGLLIKLMKLRSTDSTSFSKCLSSTRLEYMSPDIQNEIIQLLAHDVQRRISEELRNFKYFMICADGTTDITGQEQLSVILRSVAPDFTVNEYFLGLVTMVSTTGEKIADTIKDVLLRLNIDISYCRGQIYDGAANMIGIHKGVRAEIQKIVPEAVFVYCKNHGLNLDLQHTIESSRWSCDLMQFLNSQSNFIRDSRKRFDLVKKLHSELHPDDELNSAVRRPACPTRWVLRGKLLSATRNEYDVLLQVMHDLAETADAKTAATARGFELRLYQFETLLSINLLLPIFKRVEMLSKALQSKEATIFGAIEAANYVIDELSDMRMNDTDFNEIYKNCLKISEELDIHPPKENRIRKKNPIIEYDINLTSYTPALQLSPYEHWRAKFIEFLDVLVEKLKHTFDKTNLGMIGNIEQLFLSVINTEDNKDSLISSVYTFYKNDLSSVEDLQFELQMLKRLVKSEKSPLTSITCFISMYKSLTKEVRDILPNITRLVTILLVVGVSGASAERSFSVLRRLKTWLRSTMTQARMTQLSILAIEREKSGETECLKIARAFISNERRERKFGKFPSS